MSIPNIKNHNLKNKIETWLEESVAPALKSGMLRIEIPKDIAPGIEDESIHENRAFSVMMEQCRIESGTLIRMV